MNTLPPLRILKLTRSYNAICVCCQGRAIVNNSSRSGGICYRCTSILRFKNSLISITKYWINYKKHKRHFITCLVLKRLIPDVTTLHLGLEISKWL
jgi:hypothetical protein